MLIRTVEELDALPAGTLIEDSSGDLHYQSMGFFYEMPPYTPVYRTSQEMITRFKPEFRVVYPRRFGDKDLGAVAAAIETRRQLNPHADSISLARAALKALEGDKK